ncbi:MAG: hypothetical protein O3A22_03855 [Bacteroidetes bacterium]|jgi:hypothetical protein|nr:hypothetical protein [Bacteroidota bacterium]MDA1383016.1 hypothetical protein [Bacteroidota bacterium]
MKKLFTIFACASMAFTLSAQDSEQAAGSYYLGTGDALELVNIFGGDINMSATVGYAVIDDLVVSGSINGATDALMLDLSVRYFWNGVFFQAGADDLAGEASISLGAGKYFSLGSVSDRFYVDPQINYNLDTGFETKIGLGARF